MTRYEFYMKQVSECKELAMECRETLDELSKSAEGIAKEWEMRANELTIAQASEEVYYD